MGVKLGVVDMEQAADALLELLLSPEVTPLQELAFEQLALVISAASRRTWAELRSRSGSVGGSVGALPAGNAQDGEAETPPSPERAPRSYLGTLVDPLGLFRGSALVENRASDDAALAAAAKLSEIATSLLPNGEQRQISAAEANEIAQMLIRKVWERRDNIPAASRLFALKLLDQLQLRLSQPRKN